MTLKSFYPCATDARITVPICAATNVPPVGRNIFFHLFRLVCNDYSCFIEKQNYSKYITLFAEILPLVEFTAEADISDQETERLLMAPPKPDTLVSDPFVDTMIHEDVSSSMALKLDRDGLRAVDPTTVLIARWPPPLKTKYYRNLLPELQISICQECLQVILGVFWSTDGVVCNTPVKRWLLTIRSCNV